MTDEDRMALELAANSATPGPWKSERLWNGETHLRAADGELVTRPCTAYARGDTPERPDLRDRDKAYMEAANPATVLALLAELETLRREVASQRPRLAYATGQAAETLAALGIETSGELTAEEPAPAPQCAQEYTPIVCPSCGKECVVVITATGAPVCYECGYNTEEGE
jgi:hypothetical protein